MIRQFAGLALAAVALAPAGAQTRNPDFQWNKALAAGSVVSIHNINGDIKVVPSTSGRVEVLGFKRGTGSAVDHLKAEVHESSRGVDICVLYDDSDSSCDENGMHTNSRHRIFGRNDRNWDDAEMRLEVAVPTNLTVRPSSVSGDIEVTGAHGDITASTVSGDVKLDRLHASSIRANSVSGDVTVRVDELTGDGDFQFHSVSGDVVLEVPRAFAADLSMSTVSGDIDSDFPVTLGGNNRMSRRGMNARINGGGRKLSVSTVSGDLKLRMIK